MCGFTRPVDSEFASRLGVDMIGVILVKGSPRCISLSRAAEVFAALEPGTMRVVVTMLGSMEEVERIGGELKPDFIQLHHNVPPEFIEKMRERTGFRLIGVVPIPREKARLDELLVRARRISELCDLVLLDTNSPHGGGTGLTHEWRVSSSIRREIGKPVLLAGGLNPDNVRKAIDVVSPDGVDVATGIEVSPGIKDRELMRRFVRSVRGH
ncbi:MAG: phosphoribosylanthranilate isomerase [Candidatus Hadarchaeales archaeon]